MRDPLHDPASLRLMRALVQGRYVGVNINALSRRLGIHRATARKRVEWLLKNDLVRPPIFPFPGIFEEFPLVVLVWAEIPKNRQTFRFYKDDWHIFAAFSCMEGPYNTFLVEFFKDVESYHDWRGSLVRDGKLPDREHRAPADTHIMSNRLMLKNDPACFLRHLARRLEAEGTVSLGGHQLDLLSFRTMELLMRGECISTNDTRLSEELGMGRRQVSARTAYMLKAGILAPPRCQFPNLLAPPGYNLVVSRIGVRKNKGNVVEALRESDQVPRFLETITGRYHLVVFSAFERIDDFFAWGEELHDRFPGSVSAISNTILPSRTIHTVEQHKISLGFIDMRLAELNPERGPVPRLRRRRRR